MIYEHVIIGAGLSGLLKAESLLDSDLLKKGSQVLLMDPNPIAICNQTFCSWRKETQQTHSYQALIAHKYSSFRVTPPADLNHKPIEKTFHPFIYERIEGKSFYQHMHKKIFSDPRFRMLRESACSVQESDDYVKIVTNSGKEIKAFKVWNSLSQSPPDMIQHFLGFEIETESDFFTEHLVDLMDFRLDQKNQVRFVYHLPFTKRSGLVELTIFSDRTLTLDEYEKELKDYMSRVFGLTQFKVLHTESGAIPMTLDPWPKFSSPWGRSRISPIGSAAGKIKASTGYSFMRNLRDNNLKSGQWRFRVYDTLLIGIMQAHGHEISRIFPQLFAQNSSSLIFRFLDETTSFLEELQIFIKLPWKNFLVQLLLNYPFYFLIILLMGLNLALELEVMPVDLSWILWIIPLAGLIFFGISHGAIDHRLNQTPSKIQFYFRYLLGLGFFFLLWLISPELALIGFIINSSDHFGESQFLRALKISQNDWTIRIFAMIWGLGASLMAPFFHWDSTKTILQALLRNPSFGESLPASDARWIGITIAFFFILAAKLISSFEEKALGRKLSGVLPSLLLVFSLWSLPLMPGCLMFFCFWHGWDTILQQRKTLGWSSRAYAKAAAPNTLITLLGILGITLFFDSLKNWDAYLFLILGGLTVSHSLVMKKFYDFKGSL